MITKLDKNSDRLARHARVRKKVSGTADRPRFNVYRSNSHIYVQLIDDVAGNTIVSASSIEKDVVAAAKDMNKCGVAEKVGEIAAKRALEAGITEVVFDRGGYIYTGRIASVADGARKAGLKF